MKYFCVLFLLFIFVFSACDSSASGSGDPEETLPNKVIGPTELQNIAPDDLNRIITLEIEGIAVSGLVYKYSFDSVNSTLASIPVEISLDNLSDSGTVSVTGNSTYFDSTDPDPAIVYIEFWTENGSSASTKFTVRFFFQTS